MFYANNFMPYSIGTSIKEMYSCRILIRYADTLMPSRYTSDTLFDVS